MADFDVLGFGDLDNTNTAAILSNQFLWPGSLRSKRYAWNYTRDILQPEDRQTQSDIAAAQAARRVATPYPTYDSVITNAMVVGIDGPQLYMNSTGSACSSFTDAVGNVWSWSGAAPVPVFTSIPQGVGVAPAVGLNFVNTTGNYICTIASNANVSGLTTNPNKVSMYISISSLAGPQATYAAGGSSTSPKILFECSSSTGKGIGFAPVAQIMDHDYTLTGYGNIMAARNSSYSDPAFGPIYLNNNSAGAGVKRWVSTLPSGYIGAYNGKRMAPFLLNNGALVSGGACYSPASGTNSSALLYILNLVRNPNISPIPYSLVQVQPLNSCVDQYGYPVTQGVLSDISGMDLQGTMHLGNGSLQATSTHFKGILFNLSIYASNSSNNPVTTPQHRSLLRYFNTYYNYTTLPKWLTASCPNPCNTFLNGSSYTNSGNNYFDDTGFTSFSASNDTRKVYVAASGSDSNTGLAPSAAKLTIAAGASLIRDGFPDWLMLKGGDTFTAQYLSDGGNGWSKSGRSATEKMRICAFGDGRAVLDIQGNSCAFQPAFGSLTNYLAITDLAISSSTYTGNSLNYGLRIMHYASSVLIENCQVEGVYQALVIQGGQDENNQDNSALRHKNITVRRNILSNNYCNIQDGGLYKATGMYAYANDNLLLEENYWINNGVNTNGQGIHTWNSHNGYVSNGNTNVTLKNNIIFGSYSGIDTVMMRSGGTVSGNFLYGIYGSLMGLGLVNEIEPNGVSAVYVDNVTLEGTDILDGNLTLVPGGLALDIGNVSAGTIARNIWANNTSGTGSRGIAFREQVTAGQALIAKNTLVSANIIYNWGGNSISVLNNAGSVASALLSISSYGNHFINNKDTGYVGLINLAQGLSGMAASANYYSSLAAAASWFSISGVDKTLAQWNNAMTPPDSTSVASAVTYPDSSRSLVTFLPTINESANIATFISRVKGQRKGAWDTRLEAPYINAYFRAGFGR